MTLSVSHLSSRQQKNLGSTLVQYNPSSSIFKYFLDYGLCDNSYLLCINYDLELINIFLKFKHSKSQNFMLNCHPFKPTFKDSTPCSTWKQTSNNLKYSSYHIHYPNLACFSSLKSQLQCAFAYQIPSFPPKPVLNCVTKPKRVL